MTAQATSALMDLFGVSDEARDTAWEEQVFSVLPTVELLFQKDEDEALRQGADGFYYLHMGLPSQDEMKTSDDLQPGSVREQLDYCLEAACGIAVFDNPLCTGEPSCLLTYGHLEALKSHDNLGGDPIGSKAPAGEQQTRISAPDESFLSPLARQMLKMIYQGNFGFENVGIAILENPTSVPSRQICLSVAAEDFESPEKAEAFLRITSWFMVPSRPLIFNPGLKPMDFVDL